MLLIIQNKLKFLTTILFISSLVFISNQSAYAEEVYVYCAADKERWYWLANKNIRVFGKWEYRIINISTYLRYFKIKGGMRIVRMLQEECIKEFGEEYKFAQPSENLSISWHPFAVENNIIVGGLFDYHIILPRI